MDIQGLKTVLSKATKLYSEERLSEIVKVMASDITERLSESNPIILCVMNGALMVTSDLIKHLNFPLQNDYVHCSRYGHDKVGGEFIWKKKPSIQLKDRTVIIVDDILDGGVTLANIKQYVEDEGAKDVYTAVLLDKKVGREEDGLESADFVGVEIQDQFVFGYGLDYCGYHRNVPAIYMVEEE